jgi:hypothetical protein
MENMAIQWLAHRLKSPVPPTAEELNKLWLNCRALLAQHYEKEMNKLIASKEFNNALEFSTVAKGICDEDMLPRGLKDIPQEENGVLSGSTLRTWKNASRKNMVTCTSVIF